MADVEREVYEKMKRGSMSDADISFVQQHGTRQMRDEMTKRANAAYKEKQHYSRVTGLSMNSLDGIDDKGRPFKELNPGIDFNSK